VTFFADFRQGKKPSYWPCFAVSVAVADESIFIFLFSDPSIHLSLFLSFGSRLGSIWLVDLFELNIKEKRGVGRDVARESALAICVVARDVQSSLLADLHGQNTLIPAFDDLADANGGLEVAAADGAVELVALGSTWALQPAGIFNGDSVALLGDWAIAGSKYGLLDTHDCCCGMEVAEGLEVELEELGCCGWSCSAGEKGGGELEHESVWKGEMREFEEKRYLYGNRMM